MNILQWNLNGLSARYDFLKLLISNNNPDVICIQESHFKINNHTNLRGYSCLFKNRNSTYASGGVATYVRNNIPYKQININSELELVAVTIQAKQKLHIYNLYIPNSHILTANELSLISDQLIHPCIILGDFNSHNSIWGSQKNDTTRGFMIENWIDENNLNILNNGSPTYFNISSGTESCIDLSLSSPSLTQLTTWRVNQSLYDSDHFPIHISIQETSNPNSEISAPKWIFHKAHWSHFAEISENKISLLNPSYQDQPIDETINNLTLAIREAADLTIPKTTNKKSNNSSTGAQKIQKNR